MGSALRAGRPLIPGRFLVLVSVTRLSQPRDHSATGRTTLIEKSNNLIGNRTRDLPACSIVPQPTTPLRVPRVRWIISQMLGSDNKEYGTGLEILYRKN
jgi:hypothetical protein